MRRILVVVGLSATLAASSLSWATDSRYGGDAALQLHRADGEAFPILLIGTSDDPLLSCFSRRLTERGYSEHFKPADNPEGVVARVEILPEGVSVRVSYGTNGPRKYAAWCVAKLTACERVTRQLAAPYLAAP